MNRESLKWILIRNALLWMAAMTQPLFVTIVLDQVGWLTAERAALIGGLSLVVPFQISHLILRRDLGRLVPDDEDRA